MYLEGTQWIEKGTWYNTTICTKLNGQRSEDYFKTRYKYRYNLMCYVYAYDKENAPMTNDASSGGGIPMPSTSYKKHFTHLFIQSNLLKYWLQCFDVNY